MSTTIFVPVMVEYKEKLEQGAQFRPDGWQIQTPVGSEIVSFALDPKANIVAFVKRPKTGINVAHPLLLIPVGGEYEPVIGRSIGKGFGVWITPNVGPIGIFADDPWPKKSPLLS